MNSFIDAWRQQNPGDPRSDTELTLDLGDQFPEELTRNPDFKADYEAFYDILRRAEKSNATMAGEAAKGLKRGVASLGSTVAGGYALGLKKGASIAGGLPGRFWNSMGDKALGVYKDLSQSASENQGAVHGIEDIGGAEDFSKWAAGAAGEVVPSIAEAVVTGILGGLAGGAAGSVVEPGGGTLVGAGGGLVTGMVGKQAVKNILKAAVEKKLASGVLSVAGEAAKKLTLKEAAAELATSALGREALKGEIGAVASRLGANAAVALNSYVLSAGEIYGNLSQEPGVDPDTAMNTALAGGLVAALPDTFLPAHIAGKVFRSRTGHVLSEAEKPRFYGYLTRMLSEAGKTVPAEAITEGFQEWVGVASEAYAKGRPIPTPQDLTPQDWSRIRNAAALGAMGGLLAAPAELAGGSGERTHPDKEVTQHGERQDEGQRQEQESRDVLVPPKDSGAPTPEGATGPAADGAGATPLNPAESYRLPPERLAALQSLASALVDNPTDAGLLRQSVAVESDSDPEVRAQWKRAYADATLAAGRKRGAESESNPATDQPGPALHSDPELDDILHSVLDTGGGLPATGESEDASPDRIVWPRPGQFEVGLTEARLGAHNESPTPFDDFRSRALSASVGEVFPFTEPPPVAAIQRPVTPVPAATLSGAATANPPAPTATAVVPVDALPAPAIISQEPPADNPVIPPPVIIPQEYGRPAPAWQQVAHVPEQDLLGRVDFAGAKPTGYAARVEGKRGRSAGLRLSQAFELTDDGDAIYRDSKAGKKVVVLESADGSHVIVGSVKKNASGGEKSSNGKALLIPYVTVFGPNGSPENRRLTDVAKEGYKPIGYFKFSKSSPNFVATYSAEQWGQIAAEAGLRKQENQSGMATVPLGKTGLDVTHEGDAGVVTGYEPLSRFSRSATILDGGTVGLLVTALGPVQLDTVEAAEVEVTRALGELLPEDAQRIIDAYAPVDAQSRDVDSFGGLGLLAQAVYDAYNQHEDPNSIAEAIGTVPAIRQIQERSAGAGQGEGSDQPVAEDQPAGTADLRAGSAGLGAGAGPKSGAKDAGGGGSGAKTTGGEKGTQTGTNQGGKSPAEAVLTEVQRLAIVRELSDLELVSELEGFEERFGSQLANDTQREQLRDLVEDRMGDLMAKHRLAHESVGLATPEDIGELWGDIKDAAAARGIQVNELEAQTKSAAKEWGRYTRSANGREIITLALADLFQPTADNLVTLWHEIGHGQFSRLSAELQAQLHQAISEASNEWLGIGRYTETVGRAETNPEQAMSEGRLVESVARSLVSQGWNPEESQGTAQRLWRTFKDVMLRAAMMVQRLLRGRYSPAVAKEFFENRVKSLLSGDATDIVSFLGGPARTAASMAETMAHWGGGVLSSWTGRDGTLEFERFVPDSLDAIRLEHAIVRYRNGNGVLDAKVPSPDVDSTALAARHVAAFNAQQEVLAMLYRKWDGMGHNTARLTFEQFLDSAMLDLPVVPEQAIKTTNEQLTLNGQPAVKPDLTLGDVKVDSVRKEAALIAYRMLNGLKARWAAKAGEADETITKLPHQLNQINGREQKLATDYTNAELMFSALKLNFDHQVVRLGEDIKNAGVLARKAGLLSQIIKDLEGGGVLDQRVLTTYKSALDRMAERLAKDANLTRSFTDAMEAVAQLDVDWRNMTPGEIKAIIKSAATDRVFGEFRTGHAALEQMSGTSEDSRALLAVAVALGKSESLLMDLFRLRRAKADGDRTAANQALKMAMRDHADAIKEARRMVTNENKLAAVMDRMLNRIEELRRRGRTMLDELEQARNFEQFHEDSASVMSDELARLEAQIGAQAEEWEATHGATYEVPPHPRSNLGWVKHEVDLRSGRMSAGNVAEHISKMSAWLEATPVDLRGSQWSAMKAKRDRLSQMAARFDDDAAKLGWLVRFIGSFTDRLDALGNVPARQAAKRMRLMGGRLSAFSKDAEVAGGKWVSAMGAAMKATGLTRHEFLAVFHEPALKFLENRQDIRAGATSDADAVGAGLKEVRRWLLRNPQLAPLVNRPGAWAALEHYYRLTGESSGWLAGMAKTLGLKVLDNGLLRDVIGSPLFKVMRRVNKSAQRIYEVMRDGEWLSDRISASAVEASYLNNRQTVHQAMVQRFGGEVWTKFVWALASKSGASPFSSMTRGGVARQAARANVMEAFRLAGGNAVAFAEHLFLLEGGNPGNIGELALFVGGTLETFQDFFDSLHSNFVKLHGSLENGSPVMPRMLMDARQSENYPDDWLEYHTFDPHDMKQAVKLFAYESSFGRDMNGLKSDLARAREDYKSQSVTLSELERDAMKATLGRGARAREDELRRLAKAGGHDLTRLRQASRKAKLVAELQEQFQRLLKTQLGVPIEFRSWMELLSTVAAYTVQGPGTALTDTISLLEMPVRRLGLSAPMFRMTGVTVGTYAHAMLGTFLQTLGIQLRWNSDYVNRQNRLGIYDPDARLTAKDKLRGALLQQFTADNPWLQKAVAGLRLARAALGTGIGHGQYVTAKPWSVFTMMAQWQHVAVINGIHSAYEDAVLRAADYLSHHPSAAGQLHQPLSAKDLGYGKGFFGVGDNEAALERIRETLLRYGMNLESLARDYLVRKGAKGKADVFTDDQYQALSALAQDEVTLESNLNTRSPGMFTNPVLMMAAPLVSWGISKTAQLQKDIRDPHGYITTRAVTRSVLSMLLAVAPLGLLYAWMRDEYDEKIAGRKANVMSLKGPHPVLALMDRLGRVGTFGVLGDAVNASVNKDTNRPFGVDSRVFGISAIMQAVDAAGTWYQQGGTATWATVGRPTMQALGGSGYLQYADALNHLTGMDNSESRAVARLNVNNYLRAAGRELAMDVRPGRGSSSIPNPIKPWIGQMVLAAYANDPTGFNRAWREAVMAAREAGKDDPQTSVAESYASMNPLRAVFKTLPSQSELNRMLGVMSEDGRLAVRGSLQLFDRYGARLHVSPPALRQSKRQSVFLTSYANREALLNKAVFGLGQ